MTTDPRHTIDPQKAANMEATVLRAIATLKDELTRTINERHDELARQIHDLAEEHNHALLDQERRNAHFADRDRVEDIARNVHDAITTITTAILRIGKLETSYLHLENKIDSASQQSTEQTFHLLGGGAGYLITALLLLSSNLLVYILSHLVH
jgi:hypothetical protein